MEYFQMIMALLGVLALVFLLFWAMKKLNRRVTLSDSKNMKILERINLGPDKMLLLVSVCGKCMVLGVTNGRVEKVHELEAVVCHPLRRAGRIQPWTSLRSRPAF